MTEKCGYCCTKIRNKTFEAGNKKILDNINLKIDTDKFVVITGPNGSGKSNISDCIRWVLGEQSLKSLRGAKSEDIIFAGTQNRKSLGFAEVNMTIDNSDGGLPIDYSEVTVTRRVYRSGESEFFINKNQCRLKDIVELSKNGAFEIEHYLESSKIRKQV